MPFSKQIFSIIFTTILGLLTFIQPLHASRLPVRLAWERNSEADLAFYTVYYGTSSRSYSYFSDVDRVNPYFIFSSTVLSQAGITVPAGGRNLYVALTATDYSLNESNYSAELVVFIEPSSTTTSPATTSSPGTSSISGTIKLFIEAEDGSISSPMEVADDTTASLSEYIWVPNGTGNVMDPAEAGGTAEYAFTIPSSGNYVVWGRVISNGDNDDSLYASVDDSGYALWDTLHGGVETWVWDQINDRGLADPVIYYLAAGSHTLTIKQREDGTKIDRILITNDTSYTPTGTGEQNSTTTTSIAAIQKEYCSTNPTLILHGTIPEEGTMSITIPDNLANATAASLSLSLYDGDIPKEGYIYINNGSAIELPTDSNYNDLEHSFEMPVSAASIDSGENTIRFTHVDTWGYEVRELCVKVSFSSTPATTTIPRPSTTTVAVDVTPPTGSITINDGDETTDSRLVTLSFSADDSGSGMGEGAQMILSNDNLEWLDPKPFAPTKSWVLTPGGGVKTVYAKFCDAAGNCMDDPVTDSIELTFSCTEPIQFETTAIDSSGSYRPWCSEEKAVDGKIATGWLSPLRRETQEEYISIDMGEIKIINRIDINSNRFIGLDLFPRDFTVQVSTDNQTWNDIITEQDYKPPVTRSDSWTFEGTNARYVKLVAPGSQKFMFFYYLTYVAEIKVFGCEEPEVPEPEDLAATQSADEAHSLLSQEAFDREVAGKKGPAIEGAAPGRPGKPLFILKENE